MAFNVASFFAGGATVVISVGIGFAGGIFMTDALLGNSDARQLSRSEQHQQEANADQQRNSSSSQPLDRRSLNSSQ